MGGIVVPGAGLVEDPFSHLRTACAPRAKIDCPNCGKRDLIPLMDWLGYECQTCKARLPCLAELEGSRP